MDLAALLGASSGTTVVVHVSGDHLADGLSLAAALGTFAVALGTILLARKTKDLAEQTKGMAGDAKQTQASRGEVDARGPQRSDTAVFDPSSLIPSAWAVIRGRR